MQRRTGKTIGILFGFFILVYLSVFSVLAQTKDKKEQYDIGPKIKLKLAHLVPTNQPVHHAAELFKKIVEELTMGQVEITIYPANTFAPNVEAVEEVMRGTLDMQITTPGAAQTHIKPLGVCMLPYAFEDLRHAERHWHGPALNKIQKIYEENNIKVHNPGHWGFRQMSTRKTPIMHPEDLKGLKMRTPPEMQLQQMYRAFGAITTTIPLEEFALAMTQGVADGQCSPIWVYDMSKFYENQKYVAITDHGYQVLFIYKNLKMWNKLPPNIQRAIEYADEVAMDYTRALAYVTEKNILGSLPKKGITITRPNRAEFAAKMGPMHKAVAEYAGKKWFEEWTELIKESGLRTF
jgi:tripartite ATP-independent transporter DctP family solute receptor